MLGIAPSILGRFTVVGLMLITHRTLTQDVPCTTPEPANNPGFCVPVERCQNINKYLENNGSLTTRLGRYIQRAACVLPKVKRSFCCEPAQVVRIITRGPSEPVDKLQLLPGAAKCGNWTKSRIAYGNATAVFEFPWMALLRYKKKADISDRCGGTLISERYVLTAAHCLKTLSAIKLDHVRLGEHTRNHEPDCNTVRDPKTKTIIDRDCSKGVVDHEIESIIIHENYNTPRYENDIGLIRLKKKVKMDEHILPICLPVSETLRQLSFDKYIVTGWGATENGSSSDALMQASLTRVDNSECQGFYRHLKLSSKQMCAKGKDKVDTCRGDSGGPLGNGAIYDELSRFIQFGIVSAGGLPCGEIFSAPGLVTRVASYMDWILENINP